MQSVKILKIYIATLITKLNQLLYIYRGKIGDRDSHWSNMLWDSPNTINLYIYISICIWVNYNDLTATSLEIMVNKGNHPQMVLIQVSEIL